MHAKHLTLARLLATADYKTESYGYGELDDQRGNAHKHSKMRGNPQLASLILIHARSGDSSTESQ